MSDQPSHPDSQDKALTRRSFMRAAAGAAGAVGAGLLVSCDTGPTAVTPPVAAAKGGNGGGGGKPGGGGGGGASTRNALRIPSAQAPQGALTVGEATADLGGGNLSTVWAYNGQFPGPTLVVDQGGQATIDLYNNLADETITHWHGMIVNTENDGHPHQAFAPGGSYHYDFPIVQRATMNWYHPHPHEKTGEQVAMGLAGGFIIRDGVEDTLGLPRSRPGAADPYEIPLIVRDASFDKSGNMQYKPRSGGFEGRDFLVNGTLEPTLAADPAVYRFRLMNGSNARIYRFAFDDGSDFTLIGNDGGFLPDSPVVLNEMLLCPAERVDIMIDLRGRQGQTLMFRCLDAGWDLLEITVNEIANVDNAEIPASLPGIETLVQDGETRDFSFDGMSKINGQLYEMGRTDFTVPLGKTERWRFTTNGNAPHPVHVHGAYYQIQSRSGGRGDTYPWERGWKDSLLLEDGETVEVLIRFDTYKGLYLMHCHKLEHEDMGMMSNFEVV